MTGSVASAQLRSFIERIERLECEKKSIADDIRDVKAEAKGCGFDVGTINAIIKLRKVDANERAERDALLDTYMIALGMLPESVEGDEDYDRDTGEVTIIDRDDADGNHIRVTVDPQIAAILGLQQAMPLRSDAGLNILTKHEDIRTAPVTANELLGGFPVAAAETNAEETGVLASTRQGMSVERGMDQCVTGGESAATSCEYCDDTGDVHRIDGEWLGFCHCEYGKRLQRASEIEIDPSEDRGEFPSAEREDRAAANAGGTDVARSATRAGLADPTSNTGEGAANTALPAKSLEAAE